MKSEIEKLKAEFLAAKTEKERNAVSDKMDVLISKDPTAVAEAALESIKAVNEETEAMLLRNKLKDILPIISVAYIAKTYFNKTRAWLTQRINGSVVNGKPATFTPEELDTLKKALLDISEKINTSVSIVF